MSSAVRWPSSFSFFSLDAFVVGSMRQPIDRSIDRPGCFCVFSFCSRGGTHDRAQAQRKKRRRTKQTNSLSPPFYLHSLFIFASHWQSADRSTIMTTGINELLDPSVCSCFSTSHHRLICNRLRWSTVSIATALLIIVGLDNARRHILVFNLSRSCTQVVACTLSSMSR